MAAVLGSVSEYINNLKIYNQCKIVIKTSRIGQSVFAIASYYYLRKIGYYVYRKYYNLPPGPNGYPFIGCVIDWVTIPNWQINMTKKYGKVISIPVFNSMTILIADSLIIKQLLTKKEFLNRIERPLSKQLKFPSISSCGNALALMFINENWEKRRNHAQTVNLYI